MVRSYWKGTLVVALAWPGLLWGQAPQGAPTPPAAAPGKDEKLITVQECNKPPQKCRVLKCWTLPDGTPARDVQDVCTGEKLTILDKIPCSLMNACDQIDSRTPAQPAAPPAPLKTEAMPQPMPNAATQVVPQPMPPVVQQPVPQPMPSMVQQPMPQPMPAPSGRVYHWTGNTRPDGVPIPPAPSEMVSTPPPEESSGLLQHGSRATRARRSCRPQHRPSRRPRRPCRPRRLRRCRLRRRPR